MPNLECQDFLKKYINHYTCKHINPPRRGKMKPRGDDVYTIMYIIRCFFAYVKSYPRQTVVDNHNLLPQVTWPRAHKCNNSMLTNFPIETHFVVQNPLILHKTYVYARLARKESKMHQIRSH